MNFLIFFYPPVVGFTFHMFFFMSLSTGYEGAPSFPLDFAKYVHELLDKSQEKERTSTTPILLS